MRSLASCYNEYAIKVSDSYCGGPSGQECLSPDSTPSLPSSVSCIYRAKLSGERSLLITLTWSNHLVNIAVAEVTSNSAELQLRKKRGAETLQLCGSKIRVSWDLSCAVYVKGPEPSSGFYVAVWAESELCLYVGDRREGEGEGEGKWEVIWRRESLRGKWSVYRTQARFSEKGEAHEIEINGGGEWKSGVLSVWIDRKRAVEVERLWWNFRGNHTIFLDGVAVDLMWDLHAWLFTPCAAAVFLFRTRTALHCRLCLDHNQSDNDGALFSLFITATHPIH